MLENPALSRKEATLVGRRVDHTGQMAHLLPTGGRWARGGDFRESSFYEVG
jgi:hypothetical protein